MARNAAGDEGAPDARLALASLLAARLCHELSGTLATVLTATQIAAESVGAPGVAARAEALKLAADAALQLARRLRLLRAAWGPTSVALAVADFRTLAEGLPGHRIRLAMGEVDQAATFSAGAVHALLNLLLLAAESLPGGGEIALSGQPRGTMALAITGPRAAWPAALAGCLAEPSAAWRWLEAADRDATSAAQGVQAPLAALIAHRHNVQVTLRVSAQPHGAPPLAVDLSET